MEEIAAKGGLANYSILYRFLIWLGRIYVMVKDRRVIGFFSYIEVPFTSYAYNLQVGLDEENRGKGLGKKLIGHLAEVAKKMHNAKQIWGHTLKPRSLAFFTKKLNYRVAFEAFGVWIIKSPVIT